MNFKKFLRNHREAFTLAEVVVVMAILSIMMVAFAPVVTKKTSSTSDTFRTFVRTSGNHGAYYGTNDDNKPLVIGDTGTKDLSSSNSLIPKLFVVGTTSGEGSSRTVTPQIAFITTKEKDDLNKYIAGQLVVSGGYHPSQSLTYLNGVPGTSYLNPQSLGISVILGGKPDATYKDDIGSKKMTIVGGNACENADGEGIEGLTCLGADTAKGATMTNATNAVIIGKDAAKNATMTGATNAVIIGKDAASGTSYTVHGYGSVYLGYKAGFNKSIPNASKPAIFIGDSSIDIPYSNIFFGSKSLGAIICNDVIGWTYEEATGSCIEPATPESHQQNGDNSSFGEHIQLALLTGQNTVIPSDERLKNVGKPFTAGLDAINKINPVNFTYKRDKNKFPHVGVIAQALSTVFPNAISTNKDGYFYIRTEDMFYAAINAIKELYQMYLAHDKKLQQLEQRSAALEQQNKELQVLYLDLAKRLDKLDKKKSKDIGFTQVPVFDEIEEPKSNVDAE